MSEFTTVNTIFVLLEIVSMIANSILVHNGGWLAIVPGMFAFLIILNLHNVTTRHMGRQRREASNEQKLG